jgi:hypothetical protein
MKKPKNHEAKLAVAQVYWSADQEYKAAEVKRGRARDLVLVAITKGETVGPVKAPYYDYPDRKSYWLTHGEKERVEMDAYALWLMRDRMNSRELMRLMRVNTEKLKRLYPEMYANMLKHKTTELVTFPCLTWSEKAPVAKRVRRAKRI